MQAPKAKTVYGIGIRNFAGIDMRNAPSKVEMSRSPMCVNMIRETVGNNRKRHGYETVVTLDGRVNGFHTLKNPSMKKTIIHAGEKLYLYSEETETAQAIYTGVKDALSTSKQINSKLYILDGKGILVYDGQEVKMLEEVAYVPVVTIGKTYQGGGQPAHTKKNRMV